MFRTCVKLINERLLEVSSRCDAFYVSYFWKIIRVRSTPPHPSPSARVKASDTLPNFLSQMCANMQVILCRRPVLDNSSLFLVVRRHAVVDRTIFGRGPRLPQNCMQNEIVVTVRRTYTNAKHLPNSCRVVRDMSLRRRHVAEYSSFIRDVQRAMGQFKRQLPPAKFG